MKNFWGILLATLTLAGTIDAQITRTATFENFTAGQFFKPSFEDPLSDIVFSDSTSPGESFAIASELPEFNETNYLGGNSSSGWPSHFGFTGNLPIPANHVSVEISWIGVSFANGLSLQGLDASSSVVIQQTAAMSEPDPFTLQITSSQYDITSFKVIATDIFSAYDNISYTILPEPESMLLLISGASIAGGRRHRLRGYTSRI